MTPSCPVSHPINSHRRAQSCHRHYDITGARTPSVIDPVESMDCRYSKRNKKRPSWMHLSLSADGLLLKWLKTSRLEKQLDEWLRAFECTLFLETFPRPSQLNPDCGIDVGPSYDEVLPHATRAPASRFPVVGLIGSSLPFSSFLLATWGYGGEDDSGRFHLPPVFLPRGCIRHWKYRAVCLLWCPLGEPFVISFRLSIYLCVVPRLLCLSSLGHLGNLPGVFVDHDQQSGHHGHCDHDHGQVPTFSLPHNGSTVWVVFLFSCLCLQKKKVLLHKVSQPLWYAVEK